MNNTAIFRDEVFTEHDPGFDHIERPERLTALYSVLDELGDTGNFLEPFFSPASKETLLLNHSLAYIEKVEATSGKIYSVLAGDTFTSPKSYEAATLAAGALVKGVELLAAGKIDNGFALVRPPGHHAEKDTAMGFCLFNNIAIAAHHAITDLQLERVLIVDWDLHHGNGTQHSFYDSNKVLYISIHQSSLFPGTGSITDFGTGAGKGFTLNIPLPGGQGDLEYANIFNTLIKTVVYQYCPEMILVSAGFDIYNDDTMGSMRVSHQGFGYMTRALMKWADDLCDGRLLLTLEGGYDLMGLKKGVFAVLSELGGKKLETPFSTSIDEMTVRKLEMEQTPHPAIERVRDEAKKYWNM